MAKRLKVTLVHSAINVRDELQDTVRGLGFRGREEVVELEDTPTNRGMIDKIAHLVEVEEVEE